MNFICMRCSFSCTGVPLLWLSNLPAVDTSSPETVLAWPQGLLKEVGQRWVKVSKPASPSTQNNLSPVQAFIRTHYSLRAKLFFVVS